MSLGRKDVRVKLGADAHAALKVFARLDNLTEAELAERIIVSVLQRRITDARVTAAEIASAGLTGKIGEGQGNP